MVNDMMKHGRRRDLMGLHRGRSAWVCNLAALCAMAWLLCGCGDEGSSAENSSRAATRDGGAGVRGGDGGDPGARSAKYVVGSVVFSPDGEQTYISVLDSLEPQEIDYTEAVELAGWADLWVHEGHVYVSSREEATVTKYSVSDDGELVDEGTLSFLDYGDVDVAFWSNTFVAPDKAYMIEGVAGYVIWDPVRMEITGTFDLPAMPERDGLLVRAGTLDRANVIRDGKLYQPMYWSDEDWAVFAPDSRVVVIDIASDEVLDTIEAPCAGLDIGTRDDAGNLYFSTWTSGVYQPLVLGDEGNCVAKIPAGGSTAEIAFTFADVAGGREGAAVRHFEQGQLLLSVFHDDRVQLDEAEDPWALIADRNWRTWIYDPETAGAEPVEMLDWNSGATYVFHVDDAHYVMVPSTDYAATNVVELRTDSSVTEAFELRGWGTRLFQVR